jgi:hypothetical protein
MIKFSLATLKTAEGPKAALLVDDQYYLLRELQPPLRDVSTKQLLEEWPRAFPMLEQVVTNLSEGRLDHVVGVPVGTAELLTPVIFPNKLMAVGANYSGHLKEMGLVPAKWASMPFFLRPPTTTLVAPGKTVRLPKTTKQFDWECELAVVAGKLLKNAGREQAAQAIAGYDGLDMRMNHLGFAALRRIPSTFDLLFAGQRLRQPRRCLVWRQFRAMRLQSIKPKPSPVGIFKYDQPTLDRGEDRRVLKASGIEVLNPLLQGSAIFHGDGHWIEAALALG